MRKTLTEVFFTFFWLKLLQFKKMQKKKKKMTP